MVPTRTMVIDLVLYITKYTSWFKWFQPAQWSSILFYTSQNIQAGSNSSNPHYGHRSCFIHHKIYKLVQMVPTRTMVIDPVLYITKYTSWLEWFQPAQWSSILFYTSQNIQAGSNGSNPHNGHRSCFIHHKIYKLVQMVPTRTMVIDPVLYITKYTSWFKWFQPAQWSSILFYTSQNIQAGSNGSNPHNGHRSCFIHHKIYKLVQMVPTRTTKSKWEKH